MGEAMPTWIMQVNGSNQVEIIGSTGGDIRRDGKGAVSAEWQLNSANPACKVKVTCEEFAPIGRPSSGPSSPFASGKTAFDPTIYRKHTVEVENSGAARLDPVIINEQ
jgi:hypothetical protein